jgi:hypothetical protein
VARLALSPSTKGAVIIGLIYIGAAFDPIPKPLPRDGEETHSRSLELIVFFFLFLNLYNVEYIYSAALNCYLVLSSA